MCKVTYILFSLIKRYHAVECIYHKTFTSISNKHSVSNPDQPGISGPVEVIMKIRAWKDCKKTQTVFTLLSVLLAYGHKNPAMNVLGLLHAGAVL